MDSDPPPPPPTPPSPSDSIALVATSRLVGQDIAHEPLQDNDINSGVDSQDLSEYIDIEQYRSEYLEHLALEEIDGWAEDSSANPRTPPRQQPPINAAPSIVIDSSPLSVSLLSSLGDDPTTQSPSSSFGLGPFTHLYDFGVPGVDEPPTNYRIYIPTGWVYKPSQTEVNHAMSLLDMTSGGPSRLRVQKGKYYLYSAHFTREKYITLKWLEFVVWRFLAMAPCSHSNHARWRFLESDGENGEKDEFVLQLLVGLPYEDHIIVYSFLENIVDCQMADYYRRYNFVFQGLSLPS
jgi:hypothetical protein